MNPHKVFVENEASRGKWRDKGELKYRAVPPDYTASEEREEGGSIRIIKNCPLAISTPAINFSKF